MLAEPMLSIVVAIFNGEPFLPKFFNCLEQQKLENWELILVNDGSTDNSALLLEECRERFPNTKILHQENLGVSVARNIGMNMATGKYIAFPDIDDIIHEGMYNRLLTLAKLGNLDVAMCNGTYVYMDGSPSKLIFPLKKVPSTGIISGIEWLQKGLSSGKFLHVTWLNIYKLSFIREHQYQFEPQLHHQDIPWTTEILLNAKRVQFINESYYDYFIHSKSVSHSLCGDALRVRKVNTYLKIIDMLMDIYKKYPNAVNQTPAYWWQIGKEGFGVVLSIQAIESPKIKYEMVKRFFDEGYWQITWQNATTLKLKWRLSRRYLKLKSLLKYKS